MDIVGKVSLMMADIEGERTINYYLTLPISSRMLFYYYGIYWTIGSILMTAFLFPLGKVLLYSRFDLSQMSLIKMIPMYLTSNLFFGFFSLWLTSVLRGMSSLSALFLRVINPIWMFGCYFYSWESLREFSPILAKICLINPMVYIMEGMRSACLGSSGYLPYALSMTVLWSYIFVLAWHANKKLKVKLDAV